MSELDRRGFLTSAIATLGLSATARWGRVAAFTQAAAGAYAQRISRHSLSPRPGVGRGK